MKKRSFPVLPVIVLVLLVASAAFYLWTRPNAVSRHQAGVSVPVTNTAVAGVSNTVATAVSNGAAYVTQTPPSGGQASSSVGAKGPTAKQEVDGNGNAATSPAAAPNSSAPTPSGEDPYAWLAEPPPGTSCPPLNIAFDVTRHFGAWQQFSWWEESWRKVILASARSRLSFKPVYLELTHEELANANMFILPTGRGEVYTPAEKNVLSNFVQRGGVVLCWRGEYPVGNDFLKDYGGEIQELPLEKPFTRLSAAKVPWWANRQIEVTGWNGSGRGVFNLGKSSSAWHPVLTGRDGLAALAFRRAGKGLLLYISNQCFWGDMSAPKAYNSELMAAVFDACARLARKVDSDKPFLARDAETAPVKLNSHGLRIYACSELQKEAGNIKAYYDKMLPALKKLTGRALKDLESYIFVVGRHDLGLQECFKDDQRQVILHPPLQDDSGCGWNRTIREPTPSCDCNYFWVSPGEFSRDYARRDLEAFSRQFTLYTRVILQDRLGYHSWATNCIQEYINWRKESFDALSGYWTDGTPRTETSENRRLESDGEVDRLNRAKVFALMEECRAKKPDVVEQLYRTLDQLVAQGRVQWAVNLHQTAAIFSRVMGEDVSPLFDKYGFRDKQGRPVDWNKACFRRPKTGLDKLAPVAGRPALERSKFSSFPLKKGNGKMRGVGLEMVGCPAGTAQMGRANEAYGPLWTHQIAIPEPFWIGKTQVTRRQWAAVMGERRRSAQETALVKVLGDEETAADHLSYAEVQDFCRKLTKSFRHVIPLGYSFRPPTEAEWEYACDAGKMDGRATGGLAMADVKKVCWTRADSVERLKKQGKLPKGFDISRLPMGPVAQRSPNAWGIYDMLGNGWEWCLDTFAPPPEGKNAADARTMEHLKNIFNYGVEPANPLFSYAGANAYACARGMNYTGAGACTKTVFPVDAEPLAEMTFRVCLGPDLVMSE
ncbi:MAG: SUMF1/EgtB/PvdO family nonheme iron enzyme [Kiritimatiellae bacterium]|nr:SUMF1/EgtB/PvdO family nonheme iron enzyme [Kiritimatiellia bacterium]